MNRREAMLSLGALAIGPATVYGNKKVYGYKKKDYLPAEVSSIKPKPATAVCTWPLYFTDEQLKGFEEKHEENFGDITFNLDFNTMLGDTIKEKYCSMGLTICNILDKFNLTGPNKAFFLIASLEITSIFECMKDFNPQVVKIDWEFVCQNSHLHSCCVGTSKITSDLYKELEECTDRSPPKWQHDTVNFVVYRKKYKKIGEKTISWTAESGNLMEFKMDQNISVDDGEAKTILVVSTDGLNCLKFKMDNFII